jgi:tetratricopeptide (TPR) repeat protein
MTKDVEQPGSAGNPQWASQEYRSGRYRICVSDLLPALATRSQQKLSMLASCALYTGKFETVLEVAKTKRAAIADESLYWSIRARQGLAVRWLVKAGEVEPNSIRMHELLGETYRDMDHYIQAEEEYEAALRIDPADFSALIGAAATYLQEYRLEPAWQMIDHALAQRPSDPEAHYIAGEILIDQHQFDQAEPHLKEALAGNADFVSRIHALLGTIYSHQGRDQQAMDELKQGLASDDDGSVHYRLARLYQKTGQTKLAEAEFAETRRLQSANEIEIKQVLGQPGANNQLSPRIAETSK